MENVVITGLRRTKEEIVMRELADLKRSGTLEEIKDSVLRVHANLMALDIFEAVDISLDNGSSTDGCTVVVRPYETNLLGFHSGTYVQGTEGTVEASLHLHNPIGHAEQITFGLEYGTQRTNLASLTYTIPKPLGYRMIADVRLQQLVTDRESWSSYVERLRGGIATITSETGRHALSYELGWRRLSDPSRRASRSTINQLGDQIKSAFKYNFMTSTMDDMTFPRNGWNLRASSEVAGVGLDSNLIRFTKHQVSGQVAFPVGEDSAFHVEGTAGFLLPWGGQCTSVSDRFFLGGVCPEGLRGFNLKGVGPADGRRPHRNLEATTTTGAQESTATSGVRTVDSLGGDLSWSLLAALRFNLPNEALQAAGLRGQIFLNAGNLARLQAPTRPMRDVLSNFIGNFRCSMGVGVIWPTAIGRLEINMAQVLRRQATDQIRGGIQFGFTTTI